MSDRNVNAGGWVKDYEQSDEPVRESALGHAGLLSEEILVLENYIELLRKRLAPILNSEYNELAVDERPPNKAYFTMSEISAQYNSSRLRVQSVVENLDNILKSLDL